jgi:hypothetical protein
MELDDPFVYKKPEWLVLEEREKRREARAKAPWQTYWQLGRKA